MVGLVTGNAAAISPADSSRSQIRPRISRRTGEVRAASTFWISRTSPSALRLVSIQKSRYAKNPLRLLSVQAAPAARAGPEGLHSQPVLHNAPCPRTRETIRLRLVRSLTNLAPTEQYGPDATQRLP